MHTFEFSIEFSQYIKYLTYKKTLKEGERSE